MLQHLLADTLALSRFSYMRFIAIASPLNAGIFPDVQACDLFCTLYILLCYGDQVPDQANPV